MNTILSIGKSFVDFALTFLFSLGNTLLLFLRDHNGKPSATRLSIFVITYKVLEWGNHVVYHTHAIPLNLVYLIGICILGLAFFMKQISSGQFTDMFKSLFMNMSYSGANGFMSNYLSPEEKDIEEVLDGPGQ